jgi:HlyD family secretion protein
LQELFLLLNLRGALCSIIPSATPLVLTAEIDPRQIDRVWPGQTAEICFPNFNVHTTPDVDASVICVSVDTMAEPNADCQFYCAELGLTAAARTELGASDLVPGMPVEAFIQTGACLSASFLLKSIALFWTQAIHEECPRARRKCRRAKG